MMQAYYLRIKDTTEVDTTLHRKKNQRGQDKFISTDGYLQPGTYVILPFLFNPTNKYLDNTKFTIAIHSSHVVDLERVRVPLRIEREFLIKFCIFYGEQVRTANNSDKTNQQSDGVTIYEFKKYWDGLILLVENRHPSKYVHFYFSCTVSQNTCISRRNPSHSFTIGHGFQYILSSQNIIKEGKGIRQKHWPLIDESQLSDDIHLPQSISSAKHF